MGVYDRAKIGRCIAWIGDHFVYEYGPDQVIKFSKLDWFVDPERAARKGTHDYEICKRHFGDYILDTEIARSANGGRIAKIQRKIVGRPLRVSDLRTARVCEQFADILARYDNFDADQEGLIDLIGQKGLWRGGLSNIFVTPDHRLVIIDATLFGEDRFAAFLRPLMYILLPLGRLLQAYRLQKFRRTMV